MKRIIFFALAMIFAVQANAQQDEYLHYDLAYFSNDPVQYLQINYGSNGRRYIGKTMAFFASEMELQIDPSQIYPDTYLVGEKGDMALHDHYIGFFIDFYYREYKITLLISLNPPYPYSWANNFAIGDSDSLYTIANVWYKDNTIKQVYIFTEVAEP